MTVEQMIKQIDGMTDTYDLEKIKDITTCRLNGLKDANWNVGKSVKLQRKYWGRKPYDAKGKIVKINPKNLKVDFGGNGLWNIPKSMLELAE